jgi:hypothetical protein
MKVVKGTKLFEAVNMYTDLVIPCFA